MTLCGAKTRAGGRCRNRPVSTRTRCRMHGGLTLRWFAHPNYKHGRFSKYGTAAADARHEARCRAVAREYEREVARRGQVTFSEAQTILRRAQARADKRARPRGETKPGVAKRAKYYHQRHE